MAYQVRALNKNCFDVVVVISEMAEFFSYLTKTYYNPVIVDFSMDGIHADCAVIVNGDMLIFSLNHVE